MASSSSGLAVANAISTGAAAPTCSQPSSTDGSGPVPKPRSRPPISALWVTGPTPAVTAALNQTTAKMMRVSLASPSSTTSTTTVSSGTMWPATTRNHSSVRTASSSSTLSAPATRKSHSKQQFLPFFFPSSL